MSRYPEFLTAVFWCSRGVTKQLWRWAFADDETITSATAVGFRLAISTGWTLCRLFHMLDFTRSRGAWCKGIIEMSIERFCHRAFLIVGVSHSPDNSLPSRSNFPFFPSFPLQLDPRLHRRSKRSRPGLFTYAIARARRRKPGWALGAGDA